MPPLLLDTGSGNNKVDKPFRFEKWWLDLPDFASLVEEIWSTRSPFTSAIDTWEFKAKLFRQKMKGWSINLEATMKKEKESPATKF